MSHLVFQLAGTCNNYPWGKKGAQSLAAQLCKQTPGIDFEIKDDEYYSEMWFGDYNDFPARKLETKELLSDVIAKNKEKLLGKKVVTEMDGQLPFLPKILSIAKALPLQLHPNKSLATKLHDKDPSQFTDPNHKPEIAIALSDFELFAGFRPLDQIQPLFQIIPELHQFLPEGHSADQEWTDTTLRAVTRSLLLASPELTASIQSTLSSLPPSIFTSPSSSPSIPSTLSYIPTLLPRLQEQYTPTDPGTLVALLTMSFLTLPAGSAVYIPADGIHAYLSGDIVECMARSNNVLNAGFCPRADRNSIDLFTETLTFKAHSKEDVLLPSRETEKSEMGKTVVYSPPMSEFDMYKTDLAYGGEEEVLRSHEGPSVMIVTKGGRGAVMKADGKELELGEGFIFYIAPGLEVSWKSGNDEGLQIHTAAV